MRTAFPLLLLSALLAACGQEEPRHAVPPSGPGFLTWAHVSKQQLEAAEWKDVPVAFENQIGMRFVLIPAGAFVMGSSRGDGDEKVHEVTISEPFYMGVTEVTQAQWQAVMGTNPTKFQGPLLPVEKVSWDAAQEFVMKVNSREAGSTVSLPTEEQWEYACRAGTKTEWSFGDDDSQISDFAWISANSDKSTHAVASKRPNPWGLYDMHGNVWEWCSDEGGFGPSLRMMRGGSWTNDPRTVRSAFRKRSAPGDAHEYYGVRLVASLPRK